MKDGSQGASVITREAHDPNIRLHGADARADGRTRQQSLLLMLPIKDGVEDHLKKLLERIAHPPKPSDLELNPVVPFRNLRSVHFARILLLPSASGPPAPPATVAPSSPVPAQLVFATDFDGTLRDHLFELIDVASEGLDQLFDHCQEWPGLARHDRSARYEILSDFVARHSVAANTFYTGTMKRSVAQIRREAELRSAIEMLLDDIDREGSPTKARQIRERVRAWIFNEPRFAWMHERPGPFPSRLLPRSVTNHPGRSTRGTAIAIGAATIAFFAIVDLPWWINGALGLLVAAGACAYAYLAHLARTDPVIISPQFQQRAAHMETLEDHIVQNQITTINYIKQPLWFRRRVLQAVLWVINVAAKYLDNQGTLSGIPSIHFARWVIVDNGRRLLFFSNFDGTWESYLGDFVDKAHKGLTAIWSNCVGFPRTRGLWGGGASDEQRFKALARDSQVVTDVWYSAYRWLTVSNINDNTRLRLGLYGEMDERAAAAWLRIAQPRQRVTPVPAAVSPSETVKVAVGDVQGLVARSYKGFRHAQYVPVTLPSNGPEDARAWLRGLIPCLDRASRWSGDRVKAQGHAVNIAFTYAGLAQFGLDRTAVGFSREFVEGMAGDNKHRQRLLGDTGETAPEKWRWGGPTPPAIHAMLFLFAEDEASFDRLKSRESERARRHHVTLGTPLATTWLGDKEHFGFNDGIAQPVIGGLERDRTRPDNRTVLPAGEVILGYPNAYDVIPMSPTVPEDGISKKYLEPPEEDPARLAKARDFGRNGSYIVFRQLEQHVKAFWSDVNDRADGDPCRRKLLAAKMVGRWPNGAPLVLHSSEPAHFDTSANDFSYEQDLDGDKCPIGAHIRRTNPRDGLRPDTGESRRVSGRHHLLRRGRGYGTPLSETFDPDEILKTTEADGGRGLHFICFNTDIGRQFEFVQSTWMNSAKFDGLYGDPDPLMAPHLEPSCEDDVRCFTAQNSPVRRRYRNLTTRFVTMVGGAYLFMPGIKALRYLTVAVHGKAGTAGT
jgi:Dyp-type peroxidase family